MDLLTTTNLIAGASLGLSGLLTTLSVRALSRARKSETETNARTLDIATHLSGLLKADQFQLVADRDTTIAELREVIEFYRVQLLAQIEKEQRTDVLMAEATQALNVSGAMIGHLNGIIRSKNSDVALHEDMLEELDIELRRIFPNLPDDYLPADAVKEIFEAIVADGYVATYGGEENEKGVIARVIEKLVGEVEGLQEHASLLEGELDDTRMKHGHAVQVIQDRARKMAEQTQVIEEQAKALASQSDTIVQQAEVIGELRDEKNLVEQELTATKTAANDDSADADRYADRLAQVDALAIRLHSMIVEKNVPFELSIAETGVLVEAGVRHDVRIRPMPEAGTVGRADQLAA